jgi:hypothetical protein
VDYGVLVLSSWVQIEVVVEWRLGCDGAWLGDGGGDIGCAGGGSARLRSGADDGFLRSGGPEQEHAHGRLLHVDVSAQGRDGGGAGEGGPGAHHVGGGARADGAGRVGGADRVPARGDQPAPHAPARHGGAVRAAGDAHGGAGGHHHHALHAGAAGGRRVRLPQGPGALPDQHWARPRRRLPRLQQRQPRHRLAPRHLVRQRHPGLRPRSGLQGEPVRHRPAAAPFQCHFLASARIQSTLSNKILTELIHDCTSSSESELI